MMDPNTDASSVETVNGKPFTVHIIRKAQLIPLQAGTIDLDGVEIDNTVHFVQRTGQSRRSNSALQELFDQFAEDDIEGTPVDQRVTLNSKPVAIAVKALPEANKPGQFQWSCRAFRCSGKRGK